MKAGYSTEEFLDIIDDADSEEAFQGIFTNTQRADYYFRIISACIYSTFASLGFIINTFFCYVIWKATGLHRVSHMLMANMAMSNLLFLTFFSPYFLSTFILEANWYLGKIICKISFSMPYVTATSSFYFMALVALDRWLAIFYRKHRMSFCIAILLTVVAWMFSVFVASPYIYESKIVISGLQTDVSIRCGRLPTNYDYALNYAIFLFQYAIPLVIMIPAYSHLAYFLYKKQPIGKQTENATRRYFKKKQRLVSTLIAILIVQLLGWLPLFSLPLINKMIGKWLYGPTVACSLICLIGVTVTPICYLCNDGLNTQARETIDNIRLFILNSIRCIPSTGRLAHISTIYGNEMIDMSIYNTERTPLQSSSPTLRIHYNFDNKNEASAEVVTDV